MQFDNFNPFTEEELKRIKESRENNENKARRESYNLSYLLTKKEEDKLFDDMVMAVFDEDNTIEVNVAIFYCTESVVNSITSVAFAKEKHDLMNPNFFGEYEYDLSISGSKVLSILSKEGLSKNERAKVFILNPQNGEEMEITNESKSLVEIINKISNLCKPTIIVYAVNPKNFNSMS